MISSFRAEYIVKKQQEDQTSSSSSSSENEIHIHLEGIAIGNGLIDFVTQVMNDLP